MSSPLLAEDKFRLAYRKLLAEIVRVVELIPDLSSEWVSSLLGAPLVFPRELEHLARFEKLAVKFATLMREVTGDASTLEAIARHEIEVVMLLAVAATPRSFGSGGASHYDVESDPAPPAAKQVDVEAAPRRSSSTGGRRSRARGAQSQQSANNDPVVDKPRKSRGQRAKPPENGGLLSAERAEPAGAAPPSRPPQPPPEEPRFLSAAIAGHSKNVPLDVDTTYLLEFGVDVKKSGYASVEVRIPDTRVLFEEHEQVIELTVEVASDDFDVVQGPTPLKLPRRGPSKGKARFDITPTKKGRGTLTATIHKGGNFLMQMEISYSIGKAAAEPSSAVTHGRTIAAAANLKPRELGIAIRPAAGGGYDCTVWGAVTTRVALQITETELADAIGAARHALMEVITQRDDEQHLVFQTKLDIDAPSQEQALRTLARAGASLFQRIFFGPTSGPDVRRVGEFLRERASQPGKRLNLQIVAERFPIPWGMLYVGKIAGGAPLDWDLFLGMRHVIEQIPLQTNLGVDDSVIKSDDPSLAVSVNFNTGIDEQMKADFVARQLKFWDARSTAFGARMRVAERRTRADLLAALTGSAPDQLMYLYCHAVTSNPGDPDGINGSHLVLTGDEQLTLGDLNLEAPMTELLQGQPLIFINACESAEMTPSFYDGFVPYFMAKGARGVVGTECKTPALFAMEWALRFFPRFLAGEPIGELFLDLRREFSTNHHNPLGLVYAVYCDGDTQIQPGLS